jgi:hypothetical protein
MSQFLAHGVKERPDVGVEDEVHLPALECNVVIILGALATLLIGLFMAWQVITINKNDTMISKAAALKAIRPHLCRSRN